MMSENKDFLIKIVQFLNDPTSESLAAEVNVWRNASQRNEEFFQQITHLWNMSSGLKDLDSLNTDEAVDRLSIRLGYAPVEKQHGFIWFRNIAAAVLLAVLGYWAYHSVTEVSYLTKTTGAIIDSVLLQDGTRIYLAENSSVRYPEEIKGKTRNVYLIKGEAFFKVSKDSIRPFVVAVDSSKVTVLGTSFNISYAHEQIGLSVRTGKVKFEAPNGKETSILTAGDGLIYHRRRGVTDHFFDGSGSDYAWLTHELSFVDASLSQVFKSLEKYYKVKFNVEDSLSSYNKFNATFKDNELDAILLILEETYPLQITRTGSLITIRKK